MRGGIARGEAVILDKVYVGTGIIRAYKLEQSLDLTGIVLAEDLVCDASEEATVTFKPQKAGEPNEKKTRRVVRHRSGMVNGKDKGKTFQMIRLQAGDKYKERYKNSEPVVAAMLKCEENDLRLTNDPDYVAPARK